MLYGPAALEESEYQSKLATPGFEQIEVELTRIYTADDSKNFLANNEDMEKVLPMADRKFMSAFVRAR